MNISDVLDMIDKSKQQRSVHLKIPKFKIKSETSLKAILKDLGMRKMFTNQAELDPVSDSHLKVSDAIQKVYLEVDERGTDADAGSWKLQVHESGMFDQDDFVANHPFMFVVRDLETRIMFFQGRVLEPTRIRRKKSKVQ